MVIICNDYSKKFIEDCKKCLREKKLVRGKGEKKTEEEGSKIPS